MQIKRVLLLFLLIVGLATGAETIEDKLNNVTLMSCVNLSKSRITKDEVYFLLIMPAVCR